MGLNIATIYGGPAIATYRGATFHSKGEIKLTPEVRTFDIMASRFGKVDERQDAIGFKVSFEPAGEWESLSTLYPYASTELGSLIAPQSFAVTGLDLDTEVFTTATHGFTSGDAVMLHMSVGGTFPTSNPQVDAATIYYVKVINTTTFTLHPTSADAVAGTNAITFSVAATGTLYVDRDWPLVIHTIGGTKITLHNAAVTKMPNISASPIKTLLREVEFSGFLRNGYSRATANSIYTVEAAAFSDVTFDPANIKTVPFTAAWGSAAPWSSISTEEGWDIEFDMKLDEVKDDNEGMRSMRLSSLAVSAKCIPIGVSEAQLLDKLGLQGTGNIRGASIGGGDALNLYGPSNNPYIRLYGARLKAAPQQFDQGKTRAGQIQLVATRTFNTGVAYPLFYVGIAAPA
jgi:hypothetical protein